MSKIKLSFAAAALYGGLLVLAPMTTALAVPVAPIGKAANTIDPRSTVYYYGYHRHRYYHRPYYRHRYYHGYHHRHCWWRYGRRYCRW